MTDVLARRYRAVLRAYPRSYRSRQGEELLGTLLEFTAPGQRWPTLREVASILVEGFRTRIDVGGWRSSRAMWLDGLQLTVVLLLASASAPILTTVVRQQLSAGAGIALLVLALAATGALLRGRWLVALLLAGGWVAAQIYLFTISWQAFPISWHLLAAVFALAVLAGRHRSERPTRSARWLLAVPVMMALRAGLELLTPVADRYLHFQIVAGLVAGVGAALALLDPRAPIVVTGLLVVETLQALVQLPTPGDTTSSGVILRLPTDSLQATVTWTFPHTSTGVIFFLTPTWWALIVGLAAALLFLVGYLGVRRQNRL